MRKRENLLLMLAVILTLLFSFSISSISYGIDVYNRMAYAGPKKNVSLSYIIRGSINITSDTDFTTQGFPGTGTKDDPYIIEEYSINTSETCISIQNTNAFFIVRNCFIYSEAISLAHDGISLRNVTHGEFRNNFIQSKSTGIILYSSSENLFTNNHIKLNGNGVQLFDSSGNLFSDNIIVGNRYGVDFFSYSNNNTMINNILTHSEVGVGNWGTSNNSIIGNTISSYGDNHPTSVMLYGSSSVLVMNNIISGTNTGVSIEFHAFDNRVISNNISGCVYGIVILESSSNVVESNIVYNNSDYGVLCGAGSKNNLIYLNVIAYNNITNAYDDGNNNYWNSTGKGNYWSDYNGTGVYPIPGSAGSIDYHPSRHPSAFNLDILVLGLGGIVVAIIAFILVLPIRKRMTS